MTTRFESITDRLDQHAGRRGDAPAYTFLAEDGSEAGTVSFAELRGQALGIARRLRERTVPGERALMLYPPGLDFIPAFLGCLYAGIAAVPAYPPRRNQSAARVVGIAVDCEPSIVLTVESVRPALEGLLGGGGGLPPLPVLATDTVGAAPESGPEPFHAGPEDLAFLQYTSGSTAEPKGVMVSHANIMHNEALIRDAFEHDQDTVVVGWLPLFHDMGLLGNTLQPLYMGTRCILMAPLSFLQRPLRWLQAISAYGATTSGGPTFAYDLCCASVARGEKTDGLDLSTWSLAYVGAEPVRAGTLRTFSKIFKSCGFRPEAFYPCYGLAESTLFVTGGLKSRAPVIQRLHSSDLQQGTARRRVLPGRGSQEVVGCGAAPADLQVRIIDPERGSPVPDGEVGEIWICGGSVAAGYFHREDLTLETFGAVVAGEDPRRSYLRTGDLGYRDGEEIFVTGRLKDMIIIRGRNYYPQDIELLAEQAHERVRPGCSAAFPVILDGEEHLAVVAEIGRGPAGGDAEAAHREIVERIRAAVAAESGVEPARIILLRPGTIPRTSSGKIRRSACRNLLETGKLAEMAAGR